MKLSNLSPLVLHCNWIRVIYVVISTCYVENLSISHTKSSLHTSGSYNSLGISKSLDHKIANIQTTTQLSRERTGTEEIMTTDGGMLSSTIVDIEQFVLKYLKRLKLDPNEFLQNPTIENLRKIQEAHLQYIPFENLSQHGCSYPATVTDLQQIAVKILDKHRGGFCLYSMDC
jgi:N-acetyltransferase